MFDNESIDDMLNRFNTIVNDLVSLGETLNDDHKVRKIIRSLPKSWEVKATTINELNDAKEMDFNIFMGNLKTHEMEMQARASKEIQAKEAQKRSVALRASKAIAVSDSESSSEEEEKLQRSQKLLGDCFSKEGRRRRRRKGRSR